MALTDSLWRNSSCGRTAKMPCPLLQMTSQYHQHALCVRHGKLCVRVDHRAMQHSMCTSNMLIRHKWHDGGTVLQPMQLAFATLRAQQTLKPHRHAQQPENTEHCLLHASRLTNNRFNALAIGPLPPWASSLKHNPTYAQASIPLYPCGALADCEVALR